MERTEEDNGLRCSWLTTVVSSSWESWQSVSEIIVLDWPIVSLATTAGVCIALASGLANVHRMSGLTRDGTIGPNSRDQSLRRERGQGKLIFPVQLTTSRIGNYTRLMPSLLEILFSIEETLATTGSDLSREAEEVEGLFPARPRFSRLLFTALGSGGGGKSTGKPNVLTKAIFDEIWGVANEVAALEAGQERERLEALCYRHAANASCAPYGALAFWNADESLYRATVGDDDSLRIALSVGTFLDGTPVLRDLILGDYTLDGDVTSGEEILSYASGVMVTFALSEDGSNTETVLDWEGAFLAVAEQATLTSCRLVWQSEISTEAELEEGAGIQAGLAAGVSLTAVALVVSFILGDARKAGRAPLRWLRSAIGFTGVVSLVLSAATAGGALAIAGVPIAGVHSALVPLVCVALGLQSMFGLFSEIDNAPGVLAGRYRVSHAASRWAAKSKFVTLLLALAVSAGAVPMVSPVMRFFCGYAVAGIIVGRLIQAFILIPCTVLEEEARRTDGTRTTALCRLKGFHQLKAVVEHPAAQTITQAGTRRNAFIIDSPLSVSPPPRPRTSSSTTRKTLQHHDNNPQQRPQEQQQQQRQQQRRRLSQYWKDAGDDWPRLSPSTLVRSPQQRLAFFHRGGGGGAMTSSMTMTATTPPPSPTPPTPSSDAMENPQRSRRNGRQKPRNLFLSLPTDDDHRLAQDWGRASESRGRDSCGRGGQNFASPVPHVSPGASSPASPELPASDGEEWGPHFYFTRRSPRVKGRQQQYQRQYWQQQGQRVMHTRSSCQSTSPTSRDCWPGAGVLLEDVGRNEQQQRYQQQQQRKTYNSNASPVEPLSVVDLETERGGRHRGHRAETGAGSSRGAGGVGCDCCRGCGYGRFLECFDGALSVHRYCNWLLNEDGLKLRQTLILANFGILFAASLVIIALYGSPGYNVKTYCPRSSYLRDYVTTARGLGILPGESWLSVAAYVRSIDLSSLENQRAILELESALVSSSKFTVSSTTFRKMSAGFDSDSGTEVASSWLDAFLAWLPSSDYYYYSTAESDGYTYSSTNRSAAEADDEEEFQKALVTFLEEPTNERFSDDISFEDGKATGCRIWVRHLDFKGANAVLAIEAARDAARSVGLEPEAFVYAREYAVAEHYASIERDLTIVMGASFVLLAVVGFLFLRRAALVCILLVATSAVEVSTLAVTFLLLSGQDSGMVLNVHTITPSLFLASGLGASSTGGLLRSLRSQASTSTHTLDQDRNRPFDVILRLLILDTAGPLCSATLATSVGMLTLFVIAAASPRATDFLRTFAASSLWAVWASLSQGMLVVPTLLLACGERVVMGGLVNPRSGPTVCSPEGTLLRFLPPFIRNNNNSSISIGASPKGAEKNVEIVGTGYAFAIGSAGAAVLLGEVDGDDDGNQDEKKQVHQQQVGQVMGGSDRCI